MLALALLLFAGAAPAIDREAATSALLKGLVADGQPGLAVLVRRNGRTVLERGYGVRDLRAREPIGARTGFRLASVTKPMTAAAIMLLVRDGRLGYEDTLARALPGFPAYGSGMTIRHLLTHTSGLPDYEQLMERAEKAKGTTWSPDNQIRDDGVLALLEKETHGLFPPGTSWAYSNSGYVLLGLVAARAAGRPFRDVLCERVFAPLGMTRTLAYEKGKNEVPDRAYGHTRRSPRGSARPTRARPRPRSATAASIRAWRTSQGGTRRCARAPSCPRPRWRPRSRRSASSMARCPAGRRASQAATTSLPGNRSPMASDGSSTRGEGGRAPGTTARRWASGPSSSASRQRA